MTIHNVYAAVSPYFRRRRVRRFLQTIAPGPGDTILDVGGVAAFWGEIIDQRQLRPEQITILNVDKAIEGSVRSAGMQFVHGDGCALPFRNQQFSVVFSNSAIEHVGTWERQQAFASETRRVGQRLWVQTPAREFLIEPHLIAPFIHWFPSQLQRGLIRIFSVRGWIERPSPADINAFLLEVRLLTFAEMRELFPGCALLHERVLGMTKSYVAARPSTPDVASG